MAIRRTSTFTGLAPPSRSISPLLDGAEQLGLQPDVHLADLVEQQRAAVGLLEAADAPGDGAGERALLMAEQLRLQQRFRNGGAIDGDEAALGAAALAMQMAGENLLAGAGLAGDQHARLAGGDALGQRDHPRHDRVGVQDGAVVGADRGENGGDHLGVRRQRNVFLGAGLDGRDGRCRIGADAAGDNRHRNALCGEAGEETLDLERDVEHDQVDAPAGPDHLQPGRDVFSVQDLRAQINRDPAGGAKLAGERADDQQSHGCFPMKGLRLICALGLGKEADPLVRRQDAVEHRLEPARILLATDRDGAQEVDLVDNGLFR